MNCDQMRTEIIAYLKGELEEDRKTRIEEHLARCPACRHELEGARRVLAWTQAASDEDVVKRIGSILDDALAANADAVHVEPQSDNSLLIRVRVDGVMRDAGSVDAMQRYGVITRLKSMGELSVAETDTPQEGRFEWKAGDRTFDVRVACIPTVFGERISMRVLDKDLYAKGLDYIAAHFYDQIDIVKALIHQPMGLVIVSGPSGSGKTTSAHCLTAELATPERTVFSVEDPVEYVIPHVNQTQVNRKSGYDAPEALRAVQRQDPDVIFVGEIQDPPTAQACLDAALGGHLVIAGFNADGALQAIERLREMGVPSYLVGQSLAGITNQRLVRRICEDCREEVQASADDPAMIALGITAEDLKEHRIYRGKGCERCKGTGMKGRTMLMEVLAIDREIQSLIARGAEADEMLRQAREHGFRTLREDGRLRVLDGRTTAEEVLRVLG